MRSQAARLLAACRPSCHSVLAGAWACRSGCRPGCRCGSAEAVVQCRRYAVEAKGDKGSGKGTSPGGQKGRSPDAAPADRRLSGIIQRLLPAEVKPPKLTPAESREDIAKGKRFARLQMHQHRLWQADLTQKLKMKNAAVAALPPGLREAALVEDLTPFPLARRIPTLTPDVEGFLDRKQQQLEQQASKRFAVK